MNFQLLEEIWTVSANIAFMALLPVYPGIKVWTSKKTPPSISSISSWNKAKDILGDVNKKIRIHDIQKKTSWVAKRKVVP